MVFFEFCGKEIDHDILKTEKWLRYLWLTKENSVNLERVNSISEIRLKNHVLSYVEATLRIAEEYKDNAWYPYLERTLQWAEVSKCGQESERKQWLKKGYPLEIHNIASADIYAEESDDSEEMKNIVATLIRTHGLIGQHIRGEVNFATNAPLIELCKAEKLDDMEGLLFALNHAIIAAADITIWDNIRDEVKQLIQRIINGIYGEMDTLTRLKKLFSVFSKVDELSEAEKAVYDKIFASSELWYPTVALSSFSRNELLAIFTSILLYGEVKQISFYRLSRNLLYDYEGNRRVNVYKNRIIEMCLREYADKKATKLANEHVAISLEEEDGILYFDVKFTPVCERLIDFCVEAERSGIMTYEKNIQTIFDIFGFRRDMFDRLNNEDKYLQTMNDAANSTKVKLIEYAHGNRIVDVGSGGGVLLDLLEEKYPDREIIGTDISTNVIEALQKKIESKGHKYVVQKHNFVEGALSEPVDTVIFSSILHEVYSYTEYEGRQFNIAAVKVALKNAIASLTEGGYLLIRDGVYTASDKRVSIRFESKDGVVYCQNYLKDFKGLPKLRNEDGTFIDKACSLSGNVLSGDINLIREELYTYTWGNESYAQEVQEQFGYFTIDEFNEFLTEAGMEIVVSKTGIEPGYIEHLSPLVTLLGDMKWEDIPSYCFIVAKKI